MGCDFIVNVGPVIVINNPPVKTTEKHTSCCNDKCVKFHGCGVGRYGVGRFCPDCGSPIQEWENPIVKPLSIDCYALFNDSLWECDRESHDKTQLILIANKNTNKVGFQRFNLRNEPFKVFPEFDEIAGNIQKFHEVFVVELTKLKEIFGEVNVDIRYGTIGEISC